MTQIAIVAQRCIIHLTSMITKQGSNNY